MGRPSGRFLNFTLCSCSAHIFVGSERSFTVSLCLGSEQAKPPTPNEQMNYHCRRRPQERKMSAPPLLLTVAVMTVMFSGLLSVAESAIGVNWGTISFHKLNPSTGVDLLKDNKIQKVKLFEADPLVLRALMGSGIQVMVGIPNEILAALSSSPAAVDLWVRQNVSAYVGKGGADIR